MFLAEHVIPNNQIDKVIDSYGKYEGIIFEELEKDGNKLYYG